MMACEESTMDKMENGDKINNISSQAVDPSHRSGYCNRRNRGNFHNVNQREEEEITLNNYSSAADIEKIKDLTKMVDNISADSLEISNKPWSSSDQSESSQKMQDFYSKTPVSVLQELLSRRGMTPKYELLQEEGAIHEPTFRYRVTVLPDLIATGTGRSKKEAKHSAAKAILEKIKESSEQNFPFQDPPTVSIMNDGTSSSDVSIDNPIGMLQELCMSRRWPPPTYHTELEEGLPHERQFTIACTVFRFKETGTGKSKKVAKRLAAHKMLVCLKGMPCEDNNGTSFGLDDDDELALRLSHTNIDSTDSKGVKSSTITQNFKVSQFHKSLKSSQKPKLCQLQNTDLNDPKIKSIELIHEIAEEQSFSVTFVDIEERASSGKFQCLVQLSTVPITVCCGSGESIEEAQIHAAHTALEYLKHMTQKN